METAIEISVPATAAWKLLTDTRRWPEWGLSVAKVECRDSFIFLGSQGRVRTVFGVWLPFRITCFEAGHSWSWEVANITATGHRVESLGTERCRLIFSVPLPAAPYLIICRLALIRIKRILEKNPASMR